MYRNYKGPFMFSGQAIWSCARPVCRRLRALGVPFLGHGQPADDKGGAYMYRHILVGTSELQGQQQQMGRLIRPGQLEVDASSVS